MNFERQNGSFLNEPGYVGIWKKVLPMGEFKTAISVLHVHSSGRAARILYSFRPFHDLDSLGPRFGHWEPVDDFKAIVKLDGDDDGHRLLYIPDRQLEVRYLAGREVHERAAARDVSTHHLNVISGVDYNQMMRSYLEEGALA